LPPALNRAGIALWLPVVGYMAILFGFSSLSRLPSPPGDLSFYDVHIAAYTVLGALTARALAAGRMRNVTWPVVGGAIAISSLYGVTDEYHQLFVPGRAFDLLDIAADTLGSVVGASAVGAWGIIRRRFETRDVL
jgi:VanZ family protein